MFLKEDAANGYAALSNLKFSYATPFWQTDEQILLGEQPAELAAYYPTVPESRTPYCCAASVTAPAKTFITSTSGQAAGCPTSR
ncbi:hypothetical protein SFC43_13855 [Bacteroides sp. CR5/BHMF/2]|nr:hypothetical protein [Bacteroides sp. CR5/BHMF/2]